MATSSTGLMTAGEAERSSAPSEDDRARAIVDAAYDLLDEAGLEGLTIRAILARTGLSRRAFYDRFADKDELLLAVFARSMRAARDRCGQQTAVLSDPLARLKAVVDYLVCGEAADRGERGRAERRHAALCREHLRLAAVRPVDLGRALEPLIGFIADQLAAGMAAGVVRRDDPADLANLVYNAISTTLHAAMLADDPSAGDPARLAARIWAFCRGGVLADT